MYKLSICLFFCFCGLNALAQGSFSNTPVVDALGRPVAVNEFNSVRGSTFIYDDWKKGEVVTADGKSYKGMLLKYNVATNLLTFVYTPNEEPQRFAENVKVFTMYADRQRVFANDFPKIDGLNAKTYYEVIVPGDATATVMLLKHYRPITSTKRNTTSLGMIDGVFDIRSSYYLYKDKKMNVVKPNRKVVMDLLGDRQAELEAFANSKNIDFNKEADLKAIFEYYNSLK